MPDPQLQRDIGKMEAEIKSLTDAVRGLSTDVREIRQTLAEARGGWRTLVWIAGASGAVGAALSYVANLFMSKPG